MRTRNLLWRLSGHRAAAIPVGGTVLVVVLAVVMAGAAVPAAADGSTGTPTPTSTSSSAGGWRLTGEMNSGHGPSAGSPIAKLRDGKVLAATGAAAGGLTSVAELYDPATGRWTPTGSVNNPRWGFSNVVVLDNGNALITGGHDQQVNDYASTELYDPATGQWTFTGSLNTARRHTVVIKLNNGKVLAATGALGVPDGNRFLNSAELYDPATGTWSPTGSASVRRESADGVLLRDGRVMVVGGYTCCDSFPPDTDIYDPSTGTWSRAGDRPHGGGGMALVSLPDGRVLSVGGSYGNGGPSESAEAALFDPSTGQWTATASPHFARSGANAIVLPDGKVLVAGGGPAESELYDPATTTWSVGSALNVPRRNGHMIMLDTGDVLMAAGYDTADGRPTTVTELYNEVPTTPTPTPTPASQLRADFTANPNSGSPPLTVAFTDTSLGSPSSFGWNFGDGGANSTEQNPSHTYLAGGTFTVTLTVSDGIRTSTKSTEIVVNVRPPVRYYALGDSYSAGEGTIGYQNTNTVINQCHRSPRAYPEIFVRESGADLGALRDNDSATRFVACSGAKIENVAGKQGQFNEVAQHKVLASDADLITLTVGGNNVGFGEILEHCVTGKTAGKPNLPKSCKQAYSDVSETIQNLRKPLNNAYSKLKGSPGQPRVIVLTYPQIFSADLKHCEATNPTVPPVLGGPLNGINDAEMLWIQNRVSQMNKVIKAAAAAAGVEVLDVENAFRPTSQGQDGHELCSAEPWANGAIIDQSIRSFSFHPNELGYAALARRLLELAPGRASS